MNRGKIMFTSLMLAAILIFTGCSAAQTAPEPTTQAVTGRNEEVTYAVFPKDVITVEGTAATYDDGRISFQWDTGEWYLSADANGFPSLYKRVGLQNVYFRIFGCVDGAVGGLADFVGSAFRKELPDYDSSSQFFFSIDETGPAQDRMGILTGYYSRKEERKDNTLIFVHAVSNGKVSCVYGVWFDDGGEETAELYDKLREVNDYAVLEEYAAPVFASFRLAG